MAQSATKIAILDTSSRFWILDTSSRFWIWTLVADLRLWTLLAKHAECLVVGNKSLAKMELQLDRKIIYN